MTVENSGFQVEIPSETTLPLLLNFISETHPEKLIAVVLYDDVTKYYLDPSTKAIAKAAKIWLGRQKTQHIRRMPTKPRQAGVIQQPGNGG